MLSWPEGDFAGCKINARFRSDVSLHIFSTLSEGGARGEKFRGGYIVSGVYFADTGMGLIAIRFIQCFHNALGCCVAQAVSVFVFAHPKRVVVRNA